MRNLLGHDRRTRFEALQRVEWLGVAGEDLLHTLVAQSRWVDLRDGEVLARRGQVLDNLIVVSQGQLELSMTGRNGRRHVVRTQGMGDVFGLIPLIDGETVIHDAQAAGVSAVVLVPKEALLEALKHSHAVVMALLKTLCKRSRSSYERIADQSLLSIRGRLAKLLSKMVADANGAQVFHLSQAVLAETVGVSRQSLQTELKRFVQDGLIELAYASITVKNLQALHQLVKREA